MFTEVAVSVAKKVLSTIARFEVTGVWVASLKGCVGVAAGRHRDVAADLGIRESLGGLGCLS